MSEFSIAFKDIKKAAKEHGWAAFLETKELENRKYVFVQFVDVSNASFKFPYAEIVEPPALSVHITDGMGSKDKVGG